MNHKRLLLQVIGSMLVLLLLVACGTPQPTSTPTPVPPTPTPTPIPTGVIKGHIVGARDEKPLEDAQIILCLLSEAEESDFLCTLEAAPTALTNASGSFTLADVSPGSYVLMYGLSDELVSTPNSFGGINVTKAEPCFINMKNAVCESPEAPESLFWQDGGTLIGEAISKMTESNDEVESAAIGNRFTEKDGGLYIFAGSVRSNRTGISIMIRNGKLAPVVQVQPGQTTEIDFQVIGR